MTLKPPERPTWLHLLALVALTGTGTFVGTARNSDAAHEVRAEQSRELNQTLTQLRSAVEKLSDTVQELSKKVAVIEDRQTRDARLRQ